MFFILILIFILLFCIFYISFLHKKDIFCDNFNQLFLLINSNNVKYQYIKLKHSNLYNDFILTFISNTKSLSVENFLTNNKEFLLTLSKFIDYKLNKIKTTYRSKNNLTIIENISYIISQSIYKNNPYCLFNEYIKHYDRLQIKQKENKLFKFLLAKYLIIELIKIKNELNDISNIIQKYKKHKFNVKYNKDIYNYAKYYSFLHCNSNSTYYKSKLNLNTNEVVLTLFSSLFEAEKQIKIIITYLKTMF